jgi:hypothetical protein
LLLEAARSATQRAATLATTTSGWRYPASAIKLIRKIGQVNP